jgi:hypothetical protein
MFRHLARVACVLGVTAGTAFAGSVSGKLDLPAQPQPPLKGVPTRGYLDRIENPHLPVRGFDPSPYLVVVLIPATPVETPAGTASWDLVGESFAKPLLPVRSGAEVTIKNKSKRAITITAVEDAKLIPAGPINITGSRPFTPKKEGLLTLTDPDVPHLRGRLVVLATPYFAQPDREGKYEIKDVPPGEYKLKIWYQDGWLDRPDDAVSVPEKKGEVTANAKIPAGYKIKAP